MIKENPNGSIVPTHDPCSKLCQVGSEEWLVIPPLLEFIKFDSEFPWKLDLAIEYLESYLLPLVVLWYLWLQSSGRSLADSRTGGRWGLQLISSNNRSSRNYRVYINLLLIHLCQSILSGCNQSRCDGISLVNAIFKPQVRDELVLRKVPRAGDYNPLPWSQKLYHVY